MLPRRGCSGRADGRARGGIHGILGGSFLKGSEPRLRGDLGALAIEAHSMRSPEAVAASGRRTGSQSFRHRPRFRLRSGKVERPPRSRHSPGRETSPERRTVSPSVPRPGRRHASQRRRRRPSRPRRPRSTVDLDPLAFGNRDGGGEDLNPVRFSVVVIFRGQISVYFQSLIQFTDRACR